MVSERTEIKTRRTWSPNIQSKRLYSNALQKFIRVKVSTRALRTIDKVGGLDEYLLGDKAARIRELGMGGWALRWRVMRSPAGLERRRAGREALGLTGPGPWQKEWVEPWKIGRDVKEGEEEVGEEVLLQREKGIDAILDKEDVEVELEDFETGKTRKV
jgi:large subunit ribosomal protein L28